ncbi:uncharacterized protein B0T23DRAFT_17938 [Neurospora hispaniola]|uniref:Uncharacterized protein n=1 Tax=Neurospora hispaniola TaxID=588809 RepID=A0AAJ0MV96_9PEZI|nr:hypothetical protein B0T23DRAFT_17938 [Neurospora hispaniola]
MTQNHTSYNTFSTFYLQQMAVNQITARLAQSVERETLNLKVVGSTPTSGSIPGVPKRASLFTFFSSSHSYDTVLWCLGVRSFFCSFSPNNLNLLFSTRRSGLLLLLLIILIASCCSFVFPYLSLHPKAMLRLLILLHFQPMRTSWFVHVCVNV